MQAFILVIHLVLALAMLVVILLQRSEGGALGIGGGGGGGFMTGRGVANLLTRTTAILAGGFIVTSLALVILAGGHRQSRSILDQAPSSAPVSQPSAPAIPAVPLSK